MTSKIAIVPATPDLVRAYAGKPPPFSFRGHAGLLGDRVVGLAGIYRVAGNATVFAEFAPDLDRRNIVRAIRELGEIWARWHGNLYAVCEDRESAPRTLRRLGFVPLSGPWWVRA